MKRLAFVALAAVALLLCATTESQAFGRRGHCGGRGGYCGGFGGCGAFYGGGCGSFGCGAPVYYGGCSTCGSGYALPAAPSMTYGSMPISGNMPMYSGNLQVGQWIMTPYGWGQIVSIGPARAATHSGEPRIERMPEERQPQTTRKPKAPSDK